ncbi:MAG: CHAT domain-containing tetratricopeptide repeat protein [Balneolales bacterium]
MLVATIFLLVFSFLVGLDEEDLYPSYAQADFYLQNISDQNYPTANFWSLNELASAHPLLEEYIQEKVSELDDVENNCFTDPFLHIPSLDPSHERKVFRLRKAFECSEENQLYISLLHEMSRDDAIAYTDSFSVFNLTTSEQEHVLKAIGEAHNINNLFSERDFELSDLYLFHRISFVSDDVTQINSLLEFWRDQFQNQRDVRLIDNLKFATIINGHSRLYQDDEVFQSLKLIKNDTSFPNSHFKLKLYKRLGFSTYYTGNYRDALQFYRDKLIPLSKIIDDREEQLIIRVDYGSMQFRLGNLQTALYEYELVYEDSVVIRDNRQRSVMMNNLAVGYLNSGDFNSYLLFQLDALEEAIEAEDINGQLHYLNNLYIYYKRNEGWTTALNYLNNSAKIAEKTDQKEELSRIQVSLGTYERERNQDYDKAISYLKSSINLANETGNYRQMIMAKTELFKTYFGISEIDKALIILNEIADYLYEREDFNTWLDIQAHIANIYLDQNQLSDVKKQVEIIESKTVDGFSLPHRLRIGNVLARYYFRIGDPSTALSLANSFTSEIMERLQSSADYQSGHLRMDIEFIDNFELLTDLLIQLDRPEEVLTLLDDLKNVSKFSFYNNPTLKSNILNEDELIHDFALSNRIERLRNELREAPENSRSTINNQITQAITEKNKLKDKVLRHVDDDPFSLKKVQNKLERDELILYYTILNQQMVLATISSSEINFLKEEFSFDDMQRIEQAVNDLSNGRTNLEELSWIYSKVLPGTFHKEFKKLIIIPDGFLYRIPLEVLPTGNVTEKYSYGSASYMIEDHAILYVNSLKDFEEGVNNKVQFETDFLGFGISNFDGFKSNLDHDRSLSALPFAENEVSEINENLSNLSERKTLTGDSGTEKEFRGNAGNSRIIHVASHSEVFHPDPLFSVIYMHGGENNSNYKDDGLVYAYELFEMDLTSEMVMLSSCESGSGSYIQGSGIVGLSRAFTYAGVQSLVMNLWSVRDETASSMAVSFYDYLNQGYSKDDALRESKINYINNNNSDPYLWGSFVVYGDASPIVSSPLSYLWWVSGIGSLLIGILLILGKFKRSAT